MGTGYRLSHELTEFLESGVSIILATRDARLVPAIARVMALAADGPSGIRFVLNERGAGRCVQNLRANHAASVCVADPQGYRSVQLKGSCVAIEGMDSDMRARSELWRDLFAERCARFGVTPAQVRNLWLDGDCLVRVRVHEVFEQTPGDGAGASIPAPSTGAAKP